VSGPAKPWWRLPLGPARWGSAIFATALITGFAVALVDRYDLFGFVGHRPTVPEQLAEIRHGVSGGGRRLASMERIDLHGNGQFSYVLVIRSRNLPWIARRPIPVGDVLLIFDVNGAGRLKLAFKFEPRTMSGRNFAAYVFQSQTIEDVDGDGKLDLVGAWYQFAMAPIWPAPVVLTWDDARNRYVMRALVGAPYVNPNHRSILVKARGGSATSRRASVYDKPRVLVDRFSEARVPVYAVEDFILSSGRFAPRVLVAGYAVHKSYEADAGEDEIVPWAFTLLGSDVQTYPCSLAGDPSSRAALFKPTGPLRNDLAVRWRRLRNRLFC
jgi:hypothetical protein